MKIIDGLKLKGRPAEIPDCSRDDLPQFFLDMGYKVGAEIGSHRGEFTEKFCKAGLKMYAIDPWTGYVGAGRTEKLQERQDSHYEEAKKLLEPYGCAIIRKTSMDAVKDFKDKSLDFVYIDGNHAFRYIAEDLYEWTKKVRDGGAVSGHDYFHTSPLASNVICHVDVAVNAYTRLYGIENWYVLGRKRAKEGEKRDKWRSWIWIK